MKKLIIACLVLALMVVTVCADENQTNTTTTCTDSDGGINYYVKGTLTIQGKEGYLTDACQIKTGNASYTSTDSCFGNDCYLEEAYCYSSSKSYRTYPADYYNCPNGCKDGACLSTAQPSLTVLSPNGGESWVMNSSQTIKWVSHGTHVTISLVSLDKTKEVYGLLGSIPNDGSETMWLPSDLPLGQYYLPVRCVRYCTSSAQQYDDSDAPFSIVAQIAPTPTINAIASYISGTIDKVGNTGGINTDAPDGINDEHILLGGVSGIISKVRIAGSSGGIWETPYNGSNWIVGLRPQSDPSKVDLYFNFWRQASSYTVSITFSNGATQTIPVSVPVVQPTPTPPSGVSVTLNLVGNPATGPYTLEAQTSVAGDIKV